MKLSHKLQTSQGGMMNPNQQPDQQPEQANNPAPDAPSWQPPVTPSPQPQAPAPAPSYEPAQPAFSQPQPAMSAPAVAAENPGKTLGIVSIILDLVGFSLIGLILGIMSRKKSKEAGQSTTLGTVGMVLGIIFTVLGILSFLFFMLVGFAAIQEGATLESTSPGSSYSSSLYE